MGGAGGGVGIDDYCYSPNFFGKLTDEIDFRVNNLLTGLVNFYIERIEPRILEYRSRIR